MVGSRGFIGVRMNDIKVGDLVSWAYDVDKSGLVVGIIDSPSHPIYDLVRPSVYAILMNYILLT